MSQYPTVPVRVSTTSAVSRVRVKVNVGVRYYDTMELLGVIYHRFSAMH